MSTRRQHIRNTRAYLEASFTPLLAEYPFDTTLNTLRVGDGATLENHFTRTRAIRRGVIAAKQA